MARTYYFPNILRKVHIAFLSLFKDLQVAKYDAAGNIINMRSVPINFGHKGKFISIANKKDHREHSTYLPKIAIMMNSLTPAPDKNRGGHLTEVCKYFSGSQDSLDKLYGGYPYRVGYTVTILSEHMAEASMLLEQILPSYNPHRTVTIREFDFLEDFTRDLTVLLGSVTPQFQEETPEEELKRVEFDLEFEVDCTFYRPILSSDIIKTVKVNMVDSSLSPAITGVDLTGYTYTVSGDDVDNFIVETDEWIDKI